MPMIIENANYDKNDNDVDITNDKNNKKGYFNRFKKRLIWLIDWLISTCEPH